MKKLNLLNEPYSLSVKQIEFYQEHNYIKLKDVLDKNLIDHFNELITAQVSKLNKSYQSIHERDTYGKAFLQLFNLWTKDDRIKKLALSKRLGKIAADLMKVEGTRMYHDQALFKEGGGGITPWHADQHYWPLDSDKTITAWIPLQPVPLEMGPLEFSAGSQSILEGRELSISDESEKQIAKKLRVNDFPHIIEPFDIGEVSLHSGWIFHRAGANITNYIRKVYTIIYMDKDMVLKNPENDGQLNDSKTWCPGCKVGEIINSPINPITYR